MIDNLIAPVHPGEILLHEFLEPFNLSQSKLAQDIGVSPRRINEIVQGKRAITADTALRLARYFQMSPQFWIGLQMDYELLKTNQRHPSLNFNQIDNPFNALLSRHSLGAGGINELLIL